MNGSLRPPRIAEALVAALIADPALREAALGDLAEDFADLAETRSGTVARTWYWSQVARSAVSLTLLGMTRGLMPWVRLVGSVVFGYVLLAALVMIADSWVMARLVGTAAGPSLVSAVSLAVSACCAILAGYAVALVAGRARLLSAVVLGLCCGAFSAFLLVRGDDGSPLWYQVSLTLVVLPSLLIGALFRAWRTARSWQARRGTFDPSTPEQDR